jgi:CheY-like chemotaxis protein
VERGRAQGLKDLRILLADDHPAVQMAVGRLLKLDGASVTIARDGQEAVEKALAETFDLLLMDLRMPRRSGIEATATLRAQGCRVPIVVFTADFSAEDRAAAIAAGSDAVLGKPFGLADLHDAIDLSRPRG